LANEVNAMSSWECETAEHFLFGTLIVHAVDRRSGRPLSGVQIGIADDLQSACKFG
jgi:hypothetical protein